MQAEEAEDETSTKSVRVVTSSICTMWIGTRIAPLSLPFLLWDQVGDRLGLSPLRAVGIGDRLGIPRSSVFMRAGTGTERDPLSSTETRGIRCSHHHSRR